MQDQIKYNYNRTFNTTDALTIAWDMMQVQVNIAITVFLFWQKISSKNNHQSCFYIAISKQGR